MWRMPVQIYRCVDDLQTKTTDLSITTRRFDKGQLVIGRSIKSWQSYRKLLNKKWNTSSSDRAFRRLTSSIRVCLMQRKRDLGVQHWFGPTNRHLSTQGRTYPHLFCTQLQQNINMGFVLKISIKSHDVLVIQTEFQNKTCRHILDLVSP